LLDEVVSLTESAAAKLDKLEAVTKKAQGAKDIEAKAEAYRDEVAVAQNALRADIDALEQIVPSSKWPVPSYAEMLFKL
jgi:glutamine synthetase